MVNQWSHIGAYHLTANGENQDAVCHGHHENLSVITLADGVSSCGEAKSGAEIASQALTRLFLKKGEHFLAFSNGQIAEFALSHVLYELRKRAAEEGRDVNEYSSTIASVLYDHGQGRLLLLNVGDGVIMATENGRCRVLAEPSDSSSGCYVTTTKGVERAANVRVMDAGDIESVIICSDGAWEQMLSKNGVKPEVAAMLVHRDFSALKEFLIGQDCFDDHSFISMDLQ